MTAPVHINEHEFMLQILHRMFQQTQLVDGYILITVGRDKRPAIGGNYTPEDTHELFRQLGAAEDFLRGATEVKQP